MKANAVFPGSLRHRPARAIATSTISGFIQTAAQFLCPQMDILAGAKRRNECLRRTRHLGVHGNRVGSRALFQVARARNNLGTECCANRTLIHASITLEPGRVQAEVPPEGSRVFETLTCNFVFVKTLLVLRERFDCGLFDAI